MNSERERKLSIINLVIEEYKKTPEEERSLTKISKQTGIKRQTFAKYLKAAGIEVTNYSSSVKIDETVFDVIDTEEKAYWLGFIYADGNIASNEYKFEMNLSAKDAEHMLKFCNFLKAKTKPRIRKQSPNSKGSFVCRYSVRNKHLWESLYNLGCVPNKSLILEFPDITKFTNKSLIYDFIRGYCDGDGSLGFYDIHGTVKKSCCLSFTSTPMFLLAVGDFLGIKGRIRNKSYVGHENKAYDLDYTGLKARKVAHLLYNDASIYLTRKYNIYKQFCRFEEESSRAKSSKIGRSCDVNPEVS